MRYEGNKWSSFYGELHEIPVFAKSGAIVVLAKDSSSHNLPKQVHLSNLSCHDLQLEVHLFPGASNRYELIEDDGISMNSPQSVTVFHSEYSEEKDSGIFQFSILPVIGGFKELPQVREYSIKVKGVGKLQEISASIEDSKLEVTSEESGSVHSLSTIKLSSKEILKITIRFQKVTNEQKIERNFKRFQNLIRNWDTDSNVKSFIMDNLEPTKTRLSHILSTCTNGLFNILCSIYTQTTSST